MATVQPKDGESKILVYDSEAPSGSIAKDSVVASGLANLQPVYREVITETIERSKGFGEGVSFSIGIPDVANLSFEKKSKKEVKTITRAIYRYPEK